MDEEPENTPHHYQVNVVILEGRNLALTNVNTKVNISIGKRKKTIHAKSNKTDCPYYNDFCVFHYFLPLKVLLDEILTIRVYQKSASARRLVGSFSVELGTVWAQPNHQFYHKWAVLGDPKNPSVGVRGFLKCDIVIMTKGIVIKPPKDHENDEVLEENLLVPFGSINDRHRSRIIFSVFRADGFSPYFTNTLDKKLIQPYVKITYGGTVKKTSIAKNKENPVWNEELTFTDLFPPLSQNILVELCDRQKHRHKGSLGNTNLNIKSLYEDGNEGFLPTFGPNFVYLYRPFKKFERHRNYEAVRLEPNSFTYTGRVLFAIRTEVVDYGEEVKVRKKKRKGPKAIAPIMENLYFQYNKFILFAAIFDVLFFDSKYRGKKIDIRLTIGPKRNTSEIPVKKGKKGRTATTPATGTGELEEPTHLNILTTCNKTPRYSCQFKADYSFIAFPGKFPCVHVFGEWPDSLRRMYRSNVIKKAIQNCKNEVNKIKEELQFESEKHLESSQKLKNTLADLSKSCEVILLLTNVIKLEDTNLCRERKRVYHQEIAEIAKKTKLASNKNALKAEDELKNISAYLTRLTKYAQDPENSFPDTEIWLLRNDKIVAQYRIRTEDIAFSPDLNERGILSGKPQSLIIGGKKEKIKAKLDVFVWFGLADDFVQCLNMLPGGFQHKHETCASSIQFKIPSEISYSEAHHFQCRAHIFQGKIMVGFDDTGLADSFARVIILGQNQKTQVQKKTLSPIWDETLVFPLVTLYGPSDYIKENPITITVEFLDKEKLGRPELIGRSFVTPKIKLKNEEYEPPKLKWEAINQGFKEIGKALMVTELLEISETLKNLYSFRPSKKSTPLSVPEDIRPHSGNYRLEVLFWGVRQLKKKMSLRNKVFVTVECGWVTVKSPLLKNARHRLNFPGNVQIVELELPEETEYMPGITLKLFGSTANRKSYVANCIVPSARYFLFSLFSDSEIKKQKDVHIQIIEESQKKKEEMQEEKLKKKRWLKRNKKIRDTIGSVSFAVVKGYRHVACKVFKKCKESAYESDPIREEEKMNWWVKYSASQDDYDEDTVVPIIKIYHEELEAQPEFNQFMDFLNVFDMVIGHEKKTKGGVLMGKVKAAMKLYKRPADQEGKITINKINPEEGLLARGPRNDPVKVVVRVYIICGKNLAPKDIYGKSDPYLIVQLGEQRINDKKNYAPKQLNPTFGKCFEFKGTFPQDHLLRIKVIDHDVTSKSDLIGETTIDIENRYYSKHHATCGLSKHFEKEGQNGWRDIILPTDILSKVCKESNVQQPIYEKDRVVIEGQAFVAPVPNGSRYKNEIQALSVLHRWQEMPLHGYHLVPEHVETRSLYHPKIPGIEQGKLEMWVDVFPADFRYMPPMVDITPSPPVQMELRAIVWNVDDVVLDDKSLFFNEKMSDIYVRGWILSLEEEMQKTDVHYRSLNGEGNFNWRFIFHFNYIQTERKMTVKKKRDAFDMHPEERKQACKLELQVWDNDAFGDDYLGTLILELCSMPRGAKLSNRCTLKMLAPNASKINLFKIRKTRGWWPFRRLKEKQTVGNEFELTGKIDLELEILTEAEATKSPAGKGREEPDALPPPERPATSFNWMLNPLKTFRYIIWRKLAKILILALLLTLLVFFFLTGFYAFPNYLVKKMLRA